MVKKITALFLAAVIMLSVSGCSTPASTAKTAVPVIPGYGEPEKTELSYAECFSLYEYEGGDTLITTDDGSAYLITDSAPSGLADDITVIPRSPDMIYMAASAVMCFYDALGRLDDIRFSALEADGWYIENASAAMSAGDIVYAGKYSEPDYETMLDEECDLALESTMIDHTPEVQEMIEDIGIPVMVDRASYESDPMGRAEWIKPYGVLTDHEEQATAFFDEQMDSIKELDDFTNTEKTVAFFYISTDGKVVVRRSTDYIPKMIEIAGARYVFKDLDDESGRTAVDMSMEQFYDTAIDADYIIYNGSIDSSVKTMEDLINKDPVIKNLTAVQNNNCWVTKSAMYQRTDLVAEMILDFHKLFAEDDPQDLKYISKLE